MGISCKTTVMLAAIVLFLSVTTSSSKADVPVDIDTKASKHYVEDIGWRIVGGNATTIEDAPWQVSLTHYGTHFCGGAIISEWAIVTSARCLLKRRRPIHVRTNSTRLNEGGLLTDAKKIIKHKRYSYFGYEYDIGIVLLSEPLQLGNGTEAVVLPEQDEPLAEGELLRVTGWGELSDGGQIPEVLQQVYVPVFNQKACQGILSKVTKRMFCAGYIGGGKDACHGDTGGPAVINNTLVGIISWGIGCGDPGYPRFYTKIAAFRNWLDKNALLT